MREDGFLTIMTLSEFSVTSAPILYFVSFGCCFLVSLSSKLADEYDPVLFSGFTVSFVSFPEENFDLSNELDLFNYMPLFDSLLIDFLFLVSHLSWLNILIKKVSGREPLAKLQLLSSLGLPNEAKSGIIDKV